MKYPLLPYSQLVYDMLKTNPEVYYSRFSLHINKRDVDSERLRNAFEQVLRNHPVFSMHVDDEGMQEYSPSADVLHGQYHSVVFFDEGESVRIDIAYNRILGDALSGNVCFDNLCRAYQGLPLYKDNYFAYLKQIERNKQLPRFAADKKWLEHEFADTTCPVHPRTDIPLDFQCIPIEGTLWVNYNDLKERLNILKTEYLLPITAIFSLASALAMMEYNDTDEAVLTWAYDGRETQEEQYIYGSLHRDIPFRIPQSIIENRESALQFARKQYRAGIAHSSYPFTLTKPNTEVWNYALNVLVQPSLEQLVKDCPFVFEIVLPEGEPNPAYALLDVEIHEHDDSLQLCFRYSATHYKPDSIRKFADLVRNYVEWLID